MEKKSLYFFAWSAVLVSQMYLPAGVVSGALHFYWGPRAFFGSVIGACAGFLALWAFFHLALLWPSLQTNAIRPGRQLHRAFYVLLLSSLPAAGLMYYVGEFSDAFQLHDALVVGLPSVAALVLVYWSGGAAVWASFFGSLFFWLGCFGVGDVLGPFNVYVQVASQGPLFYSLRTFSAVCSLLYLFWMVERAFPTNRQRLAALRQAFVALAALCVFCVLLKRFQTGDFSLALKGQESVFFSLAAMLVLVLRRKPGLERAFFVLSLIQTVILALYVVRGMLNPQATLMGQLVWALQLLSLGVFAGVLHQAQWKSARLSLKPKQVRVEGFGEQAA